MNRTDTNPEALLDMVIAGIRENEPEPGVVEESRRRVWSKIQAAAAAPLQAERLETCEDFRALFAEYRAGSLPGAQRLLVQDHVHDCLPCRKALHPITVRLSETKSEEAPSKRWRPQRWAVAASVLVVTSITGFYAWDFVAPPPAGNRITIVSADGPVYRVKRGGIEVASASTQFTEGDRFRTGNGAHAVVRLLDGSTVEVGERAEFGVSTNRRATDIRLERGQVIVQAAKRSRGHLYVSSPDAQVAVTGTVFSVNRGLKASRVAVIEGSVEVRYRNNEKLLAPGDQVVTDNSLARVPIADEIAWSRNVDQHLAMLKQVTDLKAKLENVRIASLRYNPRLLDSVPDNTTLYVSLPNLGRALADVQNIVKQQAAQSAEFRQMLGQGLADFDKTATAVAKVGEFLGDDIVIAVQQCRECTVVMAEVHRPGLKEHIAKEFGDKLQGMHLEFVNNRVFAGPNAAAVQAAARGGSRFAQTPFGQTVTDVYKRGTGILLAADLGATVHADRTGTEGYSALGIDRVKHLIAEQRDIDGRTEYSAVINFAGPRTGVASWIGAPGGMGSLGFVSRDAQFAASFVAKDPTLMLRDLVGFTDRMSRSNLNFDDFERETGIRAEEVAQSLGGEVTVALDGPMLPTPAWKAIVEVRNPERLQALIERVVAAANTRMTTKIEAGSEAAEGPDGRKVYFLRMPGQTLAEVHYTFVDGYGVFAPSTGLIERAVRDRRNGVSLARSRDFRRMLPGGRPNVSGLVYQNAGDLIRMMAGAAQTAMTPEQGKAASEIASKVEPMLVALYGEQDRIEVASQGSAFNLLTQAAAGRLLGPLGSNERGTSRQQKSLKANR